MDFIGQDNPVAALELDELIDEMADALPAHVELYRPGRVQGTRERVIAPNDALAYRIRKAEGVIETLRVLHAGQQWP
ncbi:type II toxin-antitoxin system RelE/ParE family toxin [Burkholderia sp. F1]|uniref:type II toxin-antitoxin system RelE/ParE family toxin n=1 Tax=Burkholderia sp. F1 TaxID=3366817 RepID=UPI003D72AE77